MAEETPERDRLEMLILKAKEAGELIKSFQGEIKLISHYDCDGICSAAIMVKALEREEKDFCLSFVEQLTSDEILELAKENNRFIIFLDLGSGQLEGIKNNLMGEDVRVIISDHHQIEGAAASDNLVPQHKRCEHIFREQSSPNLLHVNPIDYGITENISGSGIAYLLARTLSPENRELSELGVIGAIGDSQIGSIGADWGLFGLNKEILKDAQTTGKIRVSRGLRIWGKTKRPVHKALEYSVDPYIPGISGSESGSVQFLKELGIPLKNEKGKWRTLSDLSDEETKKLSSEIIKERMRGNEANPEWIFGDVYELLDKPDFRDANEFATVLNAAGKQGLGYLGVSLCLNSPKAFSDIRSVLNSYRKEIGRSLNWIYQNKESIKTMENANYILAGANVPEHVISNVTSIVSRSGFMSGDKPVFAFVDTGNGKVKISARASDSLVKKGFNLRDIMVEGVKEVGGEGGGHHGASGGRIPKGSEERFINSVELILKKAKTTEGGKHANGIGKETGKEREGDAGKEEGERGREAGEEAREGREKMEGKGLVRYLGS